MKRGTKLVLTLRVELSDDDDHAMLLPRAMMGALQSVHTLHHISAAGDESKVLDGGKIIGQGFLTHWQADLEVTHLNPHGYLCRYVNGELQRATKVGIDG
jgi:hypothetical protein